MLVTKYFIISILLPVVISSLSLLLFIPNYNSYYVNAQENNEMPYDSLLSINNIQVNNTNSPTLGNPDAPITIIDFSDFQCFMCARYVKNTEPIINETYIQTGEAKLVFKHFPIRGFDSMGASMASQCINDQGQSKFWKFHNILYHNQGQIDSGWVSKENLINFASQISGLDMDRFVDCLESEKYKEYVQSDLELAKKFKFTESPSFIIINSSGETNPEYLSGAHPFPSFASIIDKKLEKLDNR
ncbi:MAG TPA: thioredoxin domain-containing protein [Nitrososphaeraceae archaeon]